MDPTNDHNGPEDEDFEEEQEQEDEDEEIEGGEIEEEEGGDEEKGYDDEENRAGADPDEPEPPEGGEHITNVVSQVTVKALSEFSTGDMDERDRIAANVQRDQEDKPVDLVPFVYDTMDDMPPRDTQDVMSCDMDEDDDDDDIGQADGEEIEELGDEDIEQVDDDFDADLDQNELVVLDPEHPLMKRFQLKLKEVLLKRNGVLELEVREIREELATKKKEREDIGVELYGVQQELAQYQITLETLQVCLEH